MHIEVRDFFYKTKVGWQDDRGKNHHVIQLPDLDSDDPGDTSENKLIYIYIYILTI